MRSLSASLWGALALLLSPATFAADVAHRPDLSRGTIEWYKNDAYERREVLALCQKDVLDKRSRECINAAEAQPNPNAQWIQSLSIGIPIFVAALGYFLAYFSKLEIGETKSGA